MGSIRRCEGKRGVSWTIDYVSPDGKRVRQSFKTRRQAQAELTARDYKIQNHIYTDPRKYDKITLKQLVGDYVKMHQNQKGYKTGKAGIIRRITEYFPEGCLLANITYRELRLYKAHLEQTPNAFGKPRARATVNRQLSCLRHMFTVGVECDLMTKNPFDRGKRLHERENNMRLRYLEEEEIPLLLAQCTGYQAYLHDIVVCAINTGMRKAEITTLKWDQIRDGQIYLTDTKSDTPRQIPINMDLEQLFKDIRKRQGLRSKYVFTRGGKPITTSIDQSFRAVVKRAGIIDFHFHDLRHTFASHFVMRTNDLKSLQEILGHSDIKTTMRYAHLSKAHKAKAMESVCGLTSGSRSKMVKNEAFTVPMMAENRP